MSKHDPFLVTAGAFFFFGLYGAILSGMAWAMMYALGMNTDWPRGLTFACLVPVAAIFIFAQFYDTKTD